MKSDRVEVSLEHSIEEKDLGVWTDDKLKFAGHVGHIVAKGGQLLGLIKRSFVHRDADVVKTLYTALVRPHLEYANVVWHPRYKKELEQLESSPEARHKASVQSPQYSVRVATSADGTTILSVSSLSW